MRIALDLQTIGRRRTGDETYYRNLVSHYADLRPQHDYWFYYTHREAEAFFAKFQGRHHDRRLKFKNPLLRVPLAYPWELIKEPVDVFHTQYVGVRAGGAKLVLTIHDLSFEYFPESFPRDRALFLKMTRFSAKAASAILTVSENTKRDLVRLYGIPAEKIHVIYNAAHPSFAPCPDRAKVEAARRTYGIARDYFLSVGALQPRKNLRRLIDAYNICRRDPRFDQELVIVGAKAWGRDNLADGGAPDVRFLGYVAEEDLPLLYNGATALAYPSLYEGFGLPVVEAMSCGTPVIASSTSSLPEVCGEAALYVDPLSVGSIAGALKTMASNEGLRDRLSAEGLRQAGKFSWREAARKTLEVYESVSNYAS
ncbi:MAG: glycosyltransferase family 4 protein [Elusimicrobia bacterium]|nr:glycosyltransferase family 4 protein [Elusimicrobiota bacterium]